MKQPRDRIATTPPSFELVSASSSTSCDHEAPNWTQHHRIASTNQHQVPHGRHAVHTTRRVRRWHRALQTAWEVTMSKLPYTNPTG